MKLIKKRRVEVDTSDNINYGSLPCSADEIEIVWSITKFLLVDNRFRIELKVFEAILFLKSNRGYWNVRSVQMSMIRCGNDSISHVMNCDLNWPL